MIREKIQREKIEGRKTVKVIKFKKKEDSITEKKQKILKQNQKEEIEKEKKAELIFVVSKLSNGLK